MEILTLGEKIKLKRKEKNMTLKDLAGSRITPGQISLVESGKSNPSIDLLEYIAERLGTELEYFLESEEKQASKVCEFYDGIAESSINDMNIMRAQESIEKGLHYAEKYNLPYFRGKFEILLSMLKEIENNLEEAQQHCLTANAIFLKLQSVDDIVTSFIHIGRITYAMGYVSTALNYFMQADNILNEYKHIDEFLKAQIFYYIALCHNKSGNVEQAIEYSLLARDRLKVLENKKQYGETLMILSISYGKENNIDEAIKYAKEASKIFSDVQNTKKIAEIENCLGEIFAKGGNYEESFLHLNKAVKLKEDIDDKTIIDTKFKICSNYIKQSNFDMGLNIIEEIQKDISDDDYASRIKCMKYLFNIYVKKEENNKAEEVLLNGIKFIENIDSKEDLADFYVLLGQFYYNIGEKQLAAKYMGKGLDIYKGMGLILKESI